MCTLPLVKETCLSKEYSRKSRKQNWENSIIIKINMKMSLSNHRDTIDIIIKSIFTATAPRDSAYIHNTSNYHCVNSLMSLEMMMIRSASNTDLSYVI